MGEDRMTWEEFERRVVTAVVAALALRGKIPGQELRDEFEALLGYSEGSRVLAALDKPPRFCSDCGKPHTRALQTQCWDCEEARAKKAREEREAEIRADERAKVEAEIREKMAKGGEF